MAQVHAVLDPIVHHRRICEGRYVAQCCKIIPGDFAQDTAHDFAFSRTANGELGVALNPEALLSALSQRPKMTENLRSTI